MSDLTNLGDSETDAVYAARMDPHSPHLQIA